MALVTNNSQAIFIANALIAIGQGLVEQKKLIDQYAGQFTQLTLQTTFNAMGTIAVNADGTTGAKDGSPNNAHPLDPGLYPSISRLISATDIAGLNTLLQAVSTLLNGAAVTQQGQAPQLLAKITGG